MKKYFLTSFVKINLTLLKTLAYFKKISKLNTYLRRGWTRPLHPMFTMHIFQQSAITTKLYIATCHILFYGIIKRRRVVERKSVLWIIQTVANVTRNEEWRTNTNLKSPKNMKIYKMKLMKSIYQSKSQLLMSKKDTTYLWWAFRLCSTLWHGTHHC